MFYYDAPPLNKTQRIDFSEKASVVFFGFQYPKSKVVALFGCLVWSWES